jgi:hypothetical protein
LVSDFDFREPPVDRNLETPAVSIAHPGPFPGFGELIIWQEIKMLLVAVVSPDTVAPTRINALPSPVIVVVLSESFDELL